jgi:hypothetical protein
VKRDNSDMVDNEKKNSSLFNFFFLHSLCQNSYKEKYANCGSPFILGCATKNNILSKSEKHYYNHITSTRE